MRRREFIVALGGAAARPLAAQAQQVGKLPTLGFLMRERGGCTDQWTSAFMERMRELGWIEGRTIAIEYRWADGQSERLAGMAAELVQLQGRLHFHLGPSGFRCQARDVQYPHRVRGQWPTRSAAGLVAVLRGRVATSPACRCSSNDLADQAARTAARDCP